MRRPVPTTDRCSHNAWIMPSISTIRNAASRRRFSASAMRPKPQTRLEQIAYIEEMMREVDLEIAEKRGVKKARLDSAKPDEFAPKERATNESFAPVDGMSFETAILIDDDDDAGALFSDDDDDDSIPGPVFSRPAVPMATDSVPGHWTYYDKKAVLMGVKKYRGSERKWLLIKKKFPFTFEGRTPGQIKACYRSLKKQGILTVEQLDARL